MSLITIQLFTLGEGGGRPAAGSKRRRIISPETSEEESDPDSSADSGSEEDDPEEPVLRAAPSSKRSKSKQIWDKVQLNSLKKNYPFLRNLDDSVVACLSFKEIAAMAGRTEKNAKILTEKLAANFETVSEFAVAVEAGEDHCTGKSHPARFLRGYVGNSQEQWLQGRLVQGRAGLAPISNYETV